MKLYPHRFDTVWLVESERGHFLASLRIETRHPESIESLQSIALKQIQEKVSDVRDCTLALLIDLESTKEVGCA
jgi:hypothetical protein